MDENLQEKIEMLKNELRKIFGNNVDIQAISASELNSKINNYMNKPIMYIEGSRAGVSIKCKNCDNGDIKIVSEHTIANILELFPEQQRNDILYKAIQLIDDSIKEGRLYEKENGEEC